MFEVQEEKNDEKIMLGVESEMIENRLSERKREEYTYEENF